MYSRATPTNTVQLNIDPTGYDNDDLNAAFEEGHAERHVYNPKKKPEEKYTTVYWNREDQRKAMKEIINANAATILLAGTRDNVMIEVKNGKGINIRGWNEGGWVEVKKCKHHKAYVDIENGQITVIRTCYPEYQKIPKVGWK